MMSLRSRSHLVGSGRVVAAALLFMGVASLMAASMRSASVAPDRAVSTLPPDRDGYFATLPAGAWKRLPGDAACARRVRLSTWEPRPSNAAANQTRPKAEEVRGSFFWRPRGNGRSYDRLFNTWLLPRVSGQHTGTTDENIQWAACKWGISDNVLRAMAAAESTWYQVCVMRTGPACRSVAVATWWMRPPSSPVRSAVS